MYLFKTFDEWDKIKDIWTKKLSMKHKLGRSLWFSEADLNKIESMIEKLPEKAEYLIGFVSFYDEYNGVPKTADEKMSAELTGEFLERHFFLYDFPDEAEDFVEVFEMLNDQMMDYPKPVQLAFIEHLKDKIAEEVITMLSDSIAEIE